MYIDSIMRINIIATPSPLVGGHDQHAGAQVLIPQDCWRLLQFD